jgi:hypothetical protein
LIKHNSEFLKVATLLDENSIEYIVIKGQDVQFYYQRSQRFQRDIDLLFYDLDTGWKVINLLEKIGYRSQKIKLGFTNKITYLVAPLVAQIDGIEISIDIHAGAFPVCGEYSISSQELFENCRFKKSGNQNIRVPSIENMIIILLAHICQHWLVTFRDINDFYALIRSDTINWTIILEKCKRLGLCTILQILSNKASTIYPCSKEINIPMEYKLNATFNLFHKRKHFLVLLERFGFLKSIFTLYYQNKFLGLVTSILRIYYLITNNNPWYFPINNRAFKIYNDRKIRKFSGSHQISIEKLTDLGTENIYLLTSMFDGTRKLSETTFVINPGRKKEIIITPYTVYSQCDYYHGLGKPQKIKLLEKNREILKKLI